jgi:2-methylisocitrate lyase-like PEP mutase family enzyme
MNRHQVFEDLHRSGCFVIPNPWDMGSARMMAALGAKALATTSAGFAFTLGRPDMGHVSRDEALAHAADIVCATPLPVSGDFENGFADDPDEVARTIRMAAEAGLSGCSIEDTQMIEGHPAYDFGLAVERVKAAASAARGLKRPFVFCARADGLMNGVYSLDEALKRISAFAEAGADLLYVPVLPDLAALKRAVAAAGGKPVNALAAGPFRAVTVAQLAEAGARRISVGSQVARVTHAAIRDCMTAILDEGHFGPFAKAASGNEIDALLVKGAQGGNANG